MMSRNRNRLALLRSLRARRYQEGKWGYILACWWEFRFPFC